MKTKYNLCLYITAVLIFSGNIANAQNDLTDVLNDSAIPVSEMSADNIKSKQALEKAQKAIETKDFGSAIVYLTSYINSKPKKYEGYKLRGDSFYALRQYALAKNDYQTAIDLKSSDDKFLTNTKYVSAIVLGADKTEQLQNPELGELYARLMYAQKALNDPAYEISYKKAGEYNSHMYLPQPKKEDLSKINCPQKYGKVFNPQGSDENIYGAIEDIEKGDYNSAIFKSQKVISDFPLYYLGYYLNGVALVGLEKDDEAITAFENALKYNQYDFESMASLGQIYFNKAQTTFNRDDARKSNEYFKKASSYNKNSNIYYFYIGLNELQLGNLQSSISEFNKAINIKNNDYNSLYYKLIAQQIKGEYDSVKDGATKMLYKHVSNSNSVLYLRALANYKSGDYEKSLADLDTILSNISDIYNADVKIISEKEKTLTNYVYYLKSKIDEKQGNGNIADWNNAKQNPIISLLSKVEKSLKPYENILNSKEITLSDYQKYEDFYKTGLPKLLDSGVVITEKDIDNQYDYIRTTFDDMGLSFVYKNPDYKLTTISDYPYKKYSSKLSSADLEKLSQKTAEVVVHETAVEKALKPELKQSTPQSEMLIYGNQTSLAKMLATNSFGNSDKESEQAFDQIQNAQEKAKEEQKIITSNIASGETYIKEDLSVFNKQNAQDLKNILESEKQISQESVGKEQKEIVIPKQEEKIVENKEIESVEETKPAVEEESSNISTSEPEQKPHAINEKHANVNLKDYNVVPVIGQSDFLEDSDAVVLDTKPVSLYNDEDKKEIESLTKQTLLNPSIKNTSNAEIQSEAELNDDPKDENKSAKTDSNESESADIKKPLPKLRDIKDDETSVPEKTEQENDKIKSETETVQNELPVSDLVQQESEIEQELNSDKIKALDEKELAKKTAQEQIAQAKMLSELEKEKIKQEKLKAKELAKIEKEKAKQQALELKQQADLAKQEEKAKLAQEKAKQKALSDQQKAEEIAKKAQEKIALQEQKAKEHEQKLAAKKLEKEQKAKAKALIKAEKQKQKELLKLEKEKIKQEKLKAKELAKIEKEKAKQQALEEKIKLKQAIEQEKELVKKEVSNDEKSVENTAESAKENVESIINEKPINIEKDNGEKDKLDLLNIFEKKSENLTKTETQESKKTIIKELKK